MVYCLCGFRVPGFWFLQARRPWIAILSGSWSVVAHRQRLLVPDGSRSAHLGPLRLVTPRPILPRSAAWLGS
jgi:hypothetical protein